MMAKIIGIDLGTTNSAAAVVLGGKPTIIPSAEGATPYGKMFPSYVAFTKDGQLLVGEPARRQAVTNPEGTVYGIKRKMGTNYKVKIWGKEYTPQQISAFILQKIKRDAESFLGEEVKKAVITVPAYFNDNQRTATKEAGIIAGLDVVRIINEPTAAALAYGIDKSEEEQKILVFDFGGGTLDVTIMEFGEGVFEVLSTAGDTHLGGTDMDNALIEYVCKEFQKDTGIDLRGDKTAMQRLREAAERAKIELSGVYETEINLPYITADESGPKHLNMKITRSKLEELVRPIVEKCRGPIDRALADAKLKREDVDRIILVGGPTRMPIVQRFVEEYIGKKVERGIDPMECVAIGAAIQGAIIAGEMDEIVLLDVTPLSLGVETLGGVFTKIIERNTTIPCRKSQIFTTAADYQTAVEIHILQGERPMAADNVSLGRFRLEGIPPAPRGVPQIEVTFDIDADGILHVSAKDLATGKEQKITITSTTRLSKEEIERMIKEAEKFAEEDKKRRELAETRNQADSLLYTSEKMLAEMGEKITDDEKRRIKDAMDALRDVMSKDDISAIKEKIDALNKAMAEVSTRLYREAGERARKEGGEDRGDKGGEEKGGGKVVDGDYKVVD
ncbi:MAG: molecular chaperone DnaK [Thermoplasmata archaeon]|nr:MAG: molecular chaperone DnaK [Thermoplasmata archaeon]